MKLLFFVLFLIVLNESNGSYSGTPRLVQPINCDDTGLMPDPDDCTSYYQCFSMNGEWFYFSFQCAEGGYFDAITGSCEQGECQSHR